MINGFLKAGEEDWSRTSGPPRFGSIGKDAEEAGAGATTEDHQTWIAANLDDKFYGGTLAVGLCDVWGAV